MALSDKHLEELANDFGDYIFAYSSGFVSFYFDKSHIRITKNTIVVRSNESFNSYIQVKIKSYKQVKKLLAFYL